LRGYDFTIKAATIQGGSAEIAPSYSVRRLWPSCYSHPRFIHEVIDRGAQAVVRGGARCASQVLDRGAQAVARGAARCLLHVLGRGAKTDACGRSFAVLPTQVLTVGLRLWYSRLAYGMMLAVSRDAVAAGEGQLFSCSPEQSKCCLI
jgi:hypothetical protein